LIDGKLLTDGTASDFEFLFLPPKFIGGVFMRSCSPGRPSGPEKTMYRMNDPQNSGTMMW
jgi:hypothetical protein